MTFKLRIKGIEEVKRALAEIRGEIAEAVEEAIHEAANESAENIKAKIDAGSGVSQPGQPPNTKSGRLSRSVKVEHRPGGATISTDQTYASELEFGTRKMAARPVWRPEAEKLSNELPDRIMKKLRSKLRGKLK